MTTTGLSVVMPVRNGRPHLDAAIASIRDQTLRDFEFVILDDGSTDGTAEDLRRWTARDPRIRIITNPQPTGLVASAQAAVENSRAAIVARMDADDVCEPQRLRREVDVLDRSHDVVLVGTLWEGIDRAGRPVRPRDRASLVRAAPSAPFPHGSITFRRVAFDAAGGYRTGTDGWEDLDLFLRMRAVGRVAVIPDSLYGYRFRDSAGAALVEQMWEPMAVAVHAAGGGGSRNPDLDALAYLGRVRHWAGDRPGVALRMLALAARRPDRGAVRSVALAIASEMAPATARRLLSRAIRRRDAQATRLGVGSEEAHEWLFGPSS